MPNIVFSEGSGLNDSIYGKVQAPVKMLIEKRGEAFEAKSVLPELFNMQKSTHFGEKLTSMTAMDGFKPVGEGGNYPVDGMQEGFDKFIEHMTWKDSFSLTEEIISDAKMMDLRKQPLGFTSAYYRTREKFGAALFGGAISGASNIKFAGHTFDTTCADKLPLFSKVHPAKVKGAKQSNLFEDAFSEDALAAAECAMQNFKGDNDELLDVSPTTIIIPNDYELKKQVFAVIGADKDPNTANNGFNFLFGRWRVIVWNYLNQFITAGSKPWLLQDKEYNDQYAGAVWFDREALKVKSFVDENTDNNVWKGRARFTGGFNDWRAFCVGGIKDGTKLIAG